MSEDKNKNETKTSNTPGNTDTETTDAKSPNNQDVKEAEPKQPVSESNKAIDQNKPKPAPATQAKPQKAQPTTEPVKPLSKEEKDKVRIKEEFDFYTKEVGKYNSKKAIRRFYNIVEFLKKNPTPANLNYFFDLLSENKDKLLHENVTMGGISEFSLKQNNEIIIAHKLFKDLLEPKKIKPGNRSARVIKASLGEKMFNWFNKKYPKDSFV